MSYNKKQISNMKSHLIGIKEKLLENPSKYRSFDIESFKSDLTYIEKTVPTNIKSIDTKNKAAVSLAFLISIGGIIAWFMAQPFYLQVVVGAIAVLIILVCGYYVFTNSDKRKALIELLQLVKEIWDIINNLPNSTPPVANFSASTTYGEMPLTVTFTDKSTDTTSWAWTFGDNTNASGQGPQTHTYTKAGTYNVTLVASNVAGTSTANVTVTVTEKPAPASEIPPGMTTRQVGSETVFLIGGEHQVDMALALAGDVYWPGLTVKRMDSMDPHFDVLPNYLWAYYYDGSLAPQGWIISRQGYYYLNNPAEPPRNCIHSIIDTPWIQPKVPIGVPLKEVLKIEHDNGRYVFTVDHDGTIQRIVWGPMP